MDSIIRRLVKVGANVVYDTRGWYVPVAMAYPLTRYYQILFAFKQPRRYLIIPKTQNHLKWQEHLPRYVAFPGPSIACPRKQ